MEGMCYICDATEFLPVMKRIIISLICALTVLSAQGQSIWDLGHLRAVKESMDEPAHAAALKTLLAKAEMMMEAEPLSVMMKAKVPASGDRHDYMSLARYFWPDPAKPDGLPYINRDGHSNPVLKELDRERLGETAERVTYLSLAYYFTDDERYAQKAVSFLRTWFMDEDTRMNPNLEYAQMIPGHNGGKGRCYGILDTYSFVEMLDAVALLEASEAFTDEDSRALKRWFGELLEWILASPQGQEEAAAANNHGTAYDAQVIAFAMYAGREDIARSIIGEFPSRRTFTQIAPDGSQPHELFRTLAYHYSHYNLTHFIDIFLMAGKLGMDIDDAASEDGRSFYKALDFLVPYISEGGEDLWPYEQIHGFEDVSRKLCKDLYRVAVRLDPSRKDYLELFRRYADVAPDDLFNLLY